MSVTRGPLAKHDAAVALPPTTPTLLAAGSRQRLRWALLIIAALWLAVVWALAGEPSG